MGYIPVQTPPGRAPPVQRGEAANSHGRHHTSRRRATCGSRKKTSPMGSTTRSPSRERPRNQPIRRRSDPLPEAQCGRRVKAWHGSCANRNPPLNPNPYLLPKPLGENDGGVYPKQ